MELFYAALFIPLLPAMLAIKKWPEMDQAQRWFSALLFFIILNSLAGKLWTLADHTNNLPFFHVYILVEFLVLLQVFNLMFAERVKTKTWICLAIGFTLTWIINVFTGEGWWGFPDYIHALEAIIILLVVVSWFLNMLKEKVILYPYRTFEFWFCAALLIFFSGNFLLFAFSKFIFSSGKEVFAAIWKVNAILNILLYLMYTIALSWVKKTTR